MDVRHHPHRRGDRLASGSAIQGRAGDSVPHRVFMRVGGSLLFAGTVVQVVTAAFMLHPVVAVIGWFLAGGGMGLMFPRITTIVLASSDRGEEGRNTSALSLSEAVVRSLFSMVPGSRRARALDDSATRAAAASFSPWKP